MRPRTRTPAIIAAAFAVAVGLTAAPAAAQTDGHPPETTQTDPVWDASTVRPIAVDMDQGEFVAMVQEFQATGKKPWISADVTIDGRSFPGAGMRLKGNSSLWGVTPNSRPSELPWLIRLDKFADQDYNGFTRFTVRGNFTASSLNEALSVRLLEEAGLAATRSFYSSFSVNGESARLRLVVEEPDHPFDRDNFGDDGGTLYKKKFDGDFSYLGDDPDLYDEYWEPKGGDKKNWQPLFEFLDWMNNSSDAQFAAELDSRVDTTALARYLAVQDLIRNWDDIDGPGQNGYFRYSPSTGQMTVVAWDHNLAFGVFPAPPRPGAVGGTAEFVTEDDMAEFILQEGVGPMQRVTWGCPLVQRALAIPEFYQLYRQELDRLQSELFTSGRAQAILDELSQPLAASGLIDGGTLSRERSQIQAVFGQPVTPRQPQGGPGGPGPGPGPGSDCSARIEIVNDWNSGWQANVHVTSTGDALSGWRVTWTWPAGQSVESSWNANLSSSGSTVTANDVGWNGSVGAGQTLNAFGFIASGPPASPTVTCTAT